MFHRHCKTGKYRCRLHTELCAFYKYTISNWMSAAELEASSKKAVVFMWTQKRELKCYNQNATIFPLNEKPLKLVNIGSNISSIESFVNTLIRKAMTTTAWKSVLSDEIKWEFFPIVVVSVLLDGCTTWTLMKYLEKS